MPAPCGCAQGGGKGLVIRHPDTVRIQQDVVDLRLRVDPLQQLKEPGMQRGLTAGELEDFYAALSGDDTADALLQVFQWHGIHGSAARGVRIARGAGEVAGIYDLDEREARGEFLCGIFPRRTIGIPAQSASGHAVGRDTLAAAALVFGIPLRLPVESRIAGDTSLCRSVLRAGAAQEDTVPLPPYLRRTGHPADRTAGLRALEHF